MPLIQVTYDTTITESWLRRLGEVLPSVVAEAVACPEEPWHGTPGAGDIEIRFQPKSALDVGELNCVIEVRTKLFDSRLRDKHERADRIRVACSRPFRKWGSSASG